MGPIWSSIGIGSDAKVIHGWEISDLTCGDFRSMSHVCALQLSAEMTPQVIPAGTLAANCGMDLLNGGSMRHRVMRHAPDDKIYSTVCSQLAG